MTIKKRDYIEFIKKNFDGEKPIYKEGIDELIADYWGTQSSYTIRDRRLALERLNLIQGKKVRIDGADRRYVTEYLVTPNSCDKNEKHM